MDVWFLPRPLWTSARNDNRVQRSARTWANEAVLPG